MRTLGRYGAVVGILASFAAAAPAQAQASCVGRPDFDACMAAILQGQQARVAASQQAIFQQYLAAYGPWLRQQYATYRAQGGPMSFEQFAYWNLMTANGTNVQGALDAQRQQFEANQRAHATVQQGYDAYNQQWWQNQQRQSAAVGRYTTEAIRGQAPYVDPRTGQSVLLPMNAAPGQPFNWGGEIYVRDNTGAFYHRQGNGWIPLQPGR